MIAIGKDELEKLPELGITVKCYMCGKWHKVKYADEVLKDGTKVPSKLLAFFKCGGKEYLCGISGKAWKPEGDKNGTVRS